MGRVTNRSYVFFNYFSRQILGRVRGTTWDYVGLQVLAQAWGLRGTASTCTSMGGLRGTQQGAKPVLVRCASACTVSGATGCNCGEARACKVTPNVL